MIDAGFKAHEYASTRASSSRVRKPLRPILAHYQDARTYVHAYINTYKHRHTHTHMHSCAQECRQAPTGLD
jgi:hypothetical protein